MFRPRNRYAKILIWHPGRRIDNWPPANCAVIWLASRAFVPVGNVVYELRRETASESYDIRRMATKEPSTVFGRRLREARRLADIPQDRLGVQIGLDEGTASARMSRYETGTHEPPYDIAVKLAKVLHMPTAYFYCDDDELANVILVWRHLSRSERKRVKPLIEAEFATRASD